MTDQERIKELEEVLEEAKQGLKTASEVQYAQAEELKRLRPLEQALTTRGDDVGNKRGLAMAKRPGRLCPRCRAIRHGDTCPACGWEKEKWGWKSDKQRGTRQQRGYDEAWLKLRVRKLARDPLCEVCLREGHTTAAEQVHHKVPFKGKTDPLRLQWDNLQSVCRPCHAKLSAEASRR